MGDTISANCCTKNHVYSNICDRSMKMVRSLLSASKPEREKKP